MHPPYLAGSGLSAGWLRPECRVPAGCRACRTTAPHRHTTTRSCCIAANGLLPQQLKHPSGRVTRVYKLGSWCTPCGYADNKCHEQFMLERVVGSVNLTNLVRCRFDLGSGADLRWGMGVGAR